MYGKDIVHYHLSANSVESYKLNANYFLLNELFKIAKMLGKEYFILGGGSSSNKDDTLFKFKKKFSKLYMPFYIGGNIYNKDVYDKFVNIWKGQSKFDVQYFLKYRLEI
jgi:lipid II:glycine glycyltransferase (peptidoglycan interpeptide bridge formation enzyme)